MIEVVNGVRYHIQQCGDGYPLVLLHGFTGDASTWQPFCDSWKHHSRLFMVDIIGHGKTESPEVAERYQMERVVADLYSLLQKLEIDKVDLLGYSMGGRLALSFAVKHPNLIRKLVLESASPGLKAEGERVDRIQKDQELASFITNNGIHQFVDYWGKIPLFQSHENLSVFEQDRMKKQRLRNSVIGLANSLIGMGTGAQPSCWDDLERITCEVLLVTGEHDHKFCHIADEMQQKLKYSEWITIKECGHTIHVEQAEKFGTIVSGFLSNP
jgi:2-succinyl-6-hydroxy-2,4-cyclohexadiene-1-carboxylate synthase